MVGGVTASWASYALFLVRPGVGLLVRQKQVGAEVELECARVQGRELSVLLLRGDIGSCLSLLAETLRRD